MTSFKLLDKLHGKYRATKSLTQQIRDFSNWREVWSAYRDRNRNDLPALKTRKGPIIYHTEGDNPLLLFKEIFIDKCYTSPDFYTPQKDDIVIDCGANIGVFALYLSHVAQGIHVHCFEPGQQTRETLTQNIELNGYQNTVRVYSHGILDREDSLKLYKAEMTGHRSLFNKPQSEEFEEIYCIPLSKAIELINANKKIDLLKIDVEGAEVEIVQGANKNTLDKIERITLEYHNKIRPGAKEAVIDHLKKNGFTNIKVFPELPDDSLGVIQVTR